MCLGALPIFIPNRVFLQLHSLMNKFIWQNRKSRLSPSTMTRRLQLGGLGLPNLRVYHSAMLLDQVKHWWHNNTDKKGVPLESGMADIPEWRAALLDPFRDTNPRRISSPAITTLQHWRVLLSAPPPPPRQECHRC